MLLLAGLAAKIGWAPVHNWLPDAHSEAPPPVSALLSSALLPAVLVVAWRSDQALTPAVGEDLAQGVLLGFGLVSLAVAVPFLWRALAWKRLLAYSSLEHMGVLALGLAFANPLAMAGVVVHVAGHAIAKALGFYAATPLLTHVPAPGPCGDRSRPHVPVARRVHGDLARHARRPAAVTALRQRGPDRRRWIRRRATVGGRGGGDPPRPRLPRARACAARDDRREDAPARAGCAGGTAHGRRAHRVATVALLTLTVLAPWLPGSELVEAMLDVA